MLLVTVTWRWSSPTVMDFGFLMPMLRTQQTVLSCIKTTAAKSIYGSSSIVRTCETFYFSYSRAHLLFSPLVFNYNLQCLYYAPRIHENWRIQYGLELSWPVRMLISLCNTLHGNYTHTELNIGDILHILCDHILWKTLTKYKNSPAIL